MMKKLISMLLAVMLIVLSAAPAFAAGIEYKYGSSSSYGMEYGNSGGTVGVIRKTDAFGKMIYVHGSPLNNKVFALVNAPAMDHTKTIGSVTFSNYIKHNEKTLRDGARNSIKVTQVYVGIGASMRSNVDNVEFMLSYSGAFNDYNSSLLEDYNVCSDLAMIKTNTPCYAADNGTPIYKFIDYYSVRPYTNLGRNYDGTWQKGLTWVFEEHTKETDTTGGAGWGYLNDPNQYRKIYSIRVESPNGTEYYQVIVTNDTNFAGKTAGSQKPAEAVKPVEQPKPGSPAKNAMANPTASTIYVNGEKVAFEAYNINGNNYFKLRDVAWALSGTATPFNVSWNNEKGVINLISGENYGKNGALSTGNGKVKAAVLNGAPIMKDGAYVNMTAYNIEGNNFFKLRDLGDQFGFNVGWNGAENAVTIDSNM